MTNPTPRPVVSAVLAALPNTRTRPCTIHIQIDGYYVRIYRARGHVYSTKRYTAKGHSDAWWSRIDRYLNAHQAKISTRGWETSYKIEGTYTDRRRAADDAKAAVRR